MPKAFRKDLSSAPFSLARQFTAPPFFMGLEDARLKGQLLLGAVKKSGAKKTPPTPARAAAVTKVAKKSGAKGKKK